MTDHLEILSRTDSSCFVMELMESKELSKWDLTDQDIANAIYEMHCEYHKRRGSPKKAPKVKVCVNTKGISVSSKDTGEVLLYFSLPTVRDVTLCLNEAPYSKTCLLVAREEGKATYKAYMFRCQTETQAKEFYRRVSSAFQDYSDSPESQQSSGPETWSVDDIEQVNKGNFKGLWNGLRRWKAEKVDKRRPRTARRDQIRKSQSDTDSDLEMTDLLTASNN